MRNIEFMVYFVRDYGKFSFGVHSRTLQAANEWHDLHLSDCLLMVKDATDWSCD